MQREREGGSTDTVGGGGGGSTRGSTDTGVERDRGGSTSGEGEEGVPGGGKGGGGTEAGRREALRGGRAPGWGARAPRAPCSQGAAPADRADRVGPSGRRGRPPRRPRSSPPLQRHGRGGAGAAPGGEVSPARLSSRGTKAQAPPFEDTPASWPRVCPAVVRTHRIYSWQECRTGAGQPGRPPPLHPPRPGPPTCRWRHLLGDEKQLARTSPPTGLARMEGPEGPCIMPLIPGRTGMSRPSRQSDCESRLCWWAGTG